MGWVRAPATLSILVWRRDRSVEVPEVLPGLARLPEEDLALDQAAVAVKAGDLRHLGVRERLAHGPPQVGKDVRTLRRERDGRLAALDRPLHADDRRVDAEPPRDPDDHRVLDVH